MLNRKEAIEAYSVVQPKQMDFMMHPARFRLFGGAKGGGKSYAMRMECVRQCLAAPMVRGLALRRTTKEIEENMVTPMLGEIPGHLYDYNATKNVMTFKNGSTIRFGYCRNLQDVLQFQGIEYDFICIEELTHWGEREFKIIKTCLRTSRMGIVPNFFGSTNPGGKGHRWVKRLWVDRQYKPEENPNDYGFIPARVFDNEILLRANPQYLKDLEDLPEVQRKAYLLGDWNAFEGQYFPEFSDTIHVIDPFIPLDGIKRIGISMDYGYTAPASVHWHALTNQHRLITYRELYVTKHLYGEIAEEVVARTTKAEMAFLKFFVVDPSIVEKANEVTRSTGRQEIEKVFKQSGWMKRVKVIGADNNRMKGANNMRKWLKPYKDPNSNTLTASWQITKNCTNLIRTLPELIHDDVDVEDLDTDGEDHAYDDCRYGQLAFGVEPPASLAEIADLNQMLIRTQEAKDDKSRQRRRERSDNILTQSW